MHKPPTDAVFNEIRTAAIKIWIENYSNDISRRCSKK